MTRFLDRIMEFFVIVGLSLMLSAVSYFVYKTIKDKLTLPPPEPIAPGFYHRYWIDKEQTMPKS